MDIKIFDNSEELGSYLAERIKELIAKKNDAILGLATGSTPLSTYHALINLGKKGLDFSKVKTFNLDEYINCPIEKETYRSFMNHNLFKGINVNLDNTHFPSEKILDLYDKEIEKAGGVDLQIVGIGNNGHIAFNEPGTSFESKTHVVKLTESTRDANKRFFNNDISLVPHEAVTMGLSTIMKSKQIYLIADTPSKKDAIETLIHKEASTECPASVLTKHKNFTILLTKDVGAKL